MPNSGDNKDRNDQHNLQAGPEYEALEGDA
jgi:hypothetical protein